MGNIETGKFDLTGGIDLGLGNEPVIQGAMYFIFKRAQGMGYAFLRVRQRVLEIVHRINAPLVTGPVMGFPSDTVHDRIAHDQIGMSHINLCAEGFRTVGELAGPHSGKQIKVLFNASVPPGAVLSRGRVGDVVFVRDRSSAVFPHFLIIQIVNIGLSLFDQFDRKVIQVFIIVRRKIFPIFPVIAKPLHITFDGFNIRHIFFFRICIVKTEIAGSVELSCYRKIYGYGFCMSDMQPSIRFRRKTGANFRAFSARNILFDCLADKISCIPYFFFHCAITPFPCSGHG